MEQTERMTTTSDELNLEFRTVEAFELDDLLARAVFHRVRLVTVLSADGTSVQAQDRAQDSPHGVLHGVRSVGLLRFAVVLAEDAVLWTEKD